MTDVSLAKRAESLSLVYRESSQCRSRPRQQNRSRPSHVSFYIVRISRCSTFEDWCSQGGWALPEPASTTLTRFVAVHEGLDGRRVLASVGRNQTLKDRGKDCDGEEQLLASTAFDVRVPLQPSDVRGSGGRRCASVRGTVRVPLRLAGSAQVGVSHGRADARIRGEKYPVRLSPEP